MFKRLIIIFAITLITACSGQPDLQPLGPDAVILAFGNSITYGTGAARDESYPAHLQAMTGRKVINAGIPGEVTREGLRRLPRLLEKHRPDLVIICHGGNDILRKQDLVKTRDNIAEMIELSRSVGAQVLLIGVPRFGVFLQSATFYSELGETMRVPVANDVLGDILKNLSLKSDQIHPNASGYAFLAEHIDNLLRETGALQ